ncbi:transcription factor HES-5-like [Stigmatopora nigra]
MAPTVHPVGFFSKETWPHKLRKPMVEKLRRDRINTCIEELKSLLGPEFLKKQPDSKQEKADILEMAVCYLKNWQRRRWPSSQGYAHCVHRAVDFLSHLEVQNPTQKRLLGHFEELRGSPAAKSGQDSPILNPVKGAVLWRPW